MTFIEKKEHPFAGHGAIILCTICWSFNGLLIKLIDWHPMLIAGGRSFLAALLLFALRLFFKRKNTDINQKKSIPVLILGGANYATTMILFVIANKLTTSANAILLQYTAPVWAALLGWYVLKEKPRAEQWGALAMVGAGMFLFFRNTLGGGALTGDILALISGVTFGANTVILRKAKDQNPADILLCSHIFAFLASLPCFFLYPIEWSASNITGICFLGFVQLGIASALYAYGIQRVTALQAMIFMMIEPVLNPVWVLLAFGEIPSATAIAGGSIILFAIVFSAVVSWRREKKVQAV